MTVVAGIDPGYATQGLCVLEYAGNHLFDLKRAVVWERDAKEGSVEDRTKRMVVEGCQELDQIEHLEQITTEKWMGGKNPGTAYWRGWYDSTMAAAFVARKLPQVSINPAWVKAFLHPRGVAVDSGRKADVEYLSALLRLDRLLVPDAIQSLKTPELRSSKKRSKHARLHALDATVIALLGFLVTYFDPTAGKVAHFELTPAQHRVVEKLYESLHRN